MPLIVSSSVSLIPDCKLLQNNRQQYPFCPGSHTEPVSSLPPLSCSLWLDLQLLSLPGYSIQLAVDPTPPSQVQEEDQGMLRAFDAQEKVEGSIAYD